MPLKDYDRVSSVAYAQRWALSRNPEYYDFSDIGGDCTSFISQCVYAGSGVMNYTPTFGWYYISGNNKSPSWTGVPFFYNFMTTNQDVGPFAEETDLSSLLPGDVIQLGDSDERLYHTLMVSLIETQRGQKNYYVCAHTIDSKNRNLNTYRYNSIKCLHFLGVRTY